MSCFAVLLSVVGWNAWSIDSPVAAELPISLSLIEMGVEGRGSWSRGDSDSERGEKVASMLRGGITRRDWMIRYLLDRLIPFRNH